MSILKCVIWDDEIYAARWSANIAIILCELLKEKVQNENFTEIPIGRKKSNKLKLMLRQKEKNMREFYAKKVAHSKEAAK